MEYSEEPRLIFTPTSQKDYSIFYNLEMASYSEDIQFYNFFINQKEKVLELGCGSGRITHLLADNCLEITGIDISQDMIDLAEQKSSSKIKYFCEDMTSFNLPHLFNTIIIPYNTLNLLGNKQSIIKCLRLCKKHLAEHGKLLVHLYHPDKKLIKSDKKLFQFTILEQDDSTKIIKETLKSYCATKDIVTLEERYRVRTIQPEKKNRDLNHFHKLYSPLIPEWKSIFQATEFNILDLWGNFNLSPFDESTDTILLIHATHI